MACEKVVSKDIAALSNNPSIQVGFHLYSSVLSVFLYVWKIYNTMVKEKTIQTCKTDKLEVVSHLTKWFVMKGFAKIFIYIVRFLGVFKVNHLTEKLGESKHLKLKCWDHWLETNVS